MPSRPHLEWQLRRRVLQLSNVQIVRRLVTEPQFERRQQRVVGVLLDSLVAAKIGNAKSS